MTKKGFHCDYTAAWDELDPNGHVRGGVIVDLLTNTQFEWIADSGYGLDKLTAAGYGPVTSKLEVRFLRELRHGDKISDYPRSNGLAPDCSMWKTVHELRNSDGKLVATAKLEGTWLDWKRRVAIAPEPELAEVLNNLERTRTFETMKSVVKSSGSTA